MGDTYRLSLKSEVFKEKIQKGKLFWRQALIPSGSLVLKKPPQGKGAWENLVTGSTWARQDNKGKKPVGNCSAHLATPQCWKRLERSPALFYPALVFPTLHHWAGPTLVGPVSHQRVQTAKQFPRPVAGQLSHTVAGKHAGQGHTLLLTWLLMHVGSLFI